MTLLLDTQALLWWRDGSRKVGPKARAAIEQEAFGVLVSAASAWEIAIKMAVSMLPWHRADSFDRLLIAHARLKPLTIVTADNAFEAYEVRLLDARQ